jgi:hypothetical protein
MKSTMNFKDKLIDYRNRYYDLSERKAKGRFLDMLSALFGHERKYLIKLLNGQRDFKPARGRGRTYGEEVERLALRLRAAAGDPCAPYFARMLPRLVEDWEKLKGPVAEETRAQLLAASESTFARWFRRHPSSRPRHGNHRSGANRLGNGVPRCPGRDVEDGSPGVVQVDTVAHGGGGPEPFFYSMDMVDAETQWVVFDFMWCRGGMEVRAAAGGMLRQFPFKVRKLHPDGGGEFINGPVLSFLAANFPGVEVSRSRPSRPNDNCRVEQKNGSIIRSWLGQARLDNRALAPGLHELARLLCLYHNLFVPSKKLVSKAPRDRLHSSYRYVYDKPRTPLERCRESGKCDPARLASLEKTYASTNSLVLVAKIKRLVREILAASKPSGGRGEG